MRCAGALVLQCMLQEPVVQFRLAAIEGGNVVVAAQLLNLPNPAHALGTGIEKAGLGEQSFQAWQGLRRRVERLLKGCPILFA